jgi:hypothetical protein
MDPNQMTPPQPMPEFAPPPSSPAEAQGLPGDGAPVVPAEMPGQFVGPEQIAQLDEMMEKIQGKMGEYTSQKFVGENMNKAKKDKLIEDVLLSLQNAGVNINSQEEVAAYFEKLREFNPDIADLLEGFLEKIFGEEFDLPQEDVVPSRASAPGQNEEQPPLLLGGNQMAAPQGMGAQDLGQGPSEMEQVLPSNPINNYENLSKTVRERI